MRYSDLSSSFRLLNIANYSSSLSTLLLSNSQKSPQALCMLWWNFWEILTTLPLLTLCLLFGILPWSSWLLLFHSFTFYLARLSRSSPIFGQPYVKSLYPLSPKSNLAKSSGGFFGSWVNTSNLCLISRVLWGRWGRFLARSQFLHRNSVSWMLRVTMKRRRRRSQSQRLRVVEDQEYWLMEPMRQRLPIRVLALPNWRLWRLLRNHLWGVSKSLDLISYWCWLLLLFASLDPGRRFFHRLSSGYGFDQAGPSFQREDQGRSGIKHITSRGLFPPPPFSNSWDSDDLDPW